MRDKLIEMRRQPKRLCSRSIPSLTMKWQRRRRLFNPLQSHTMAVVPQVASNSLELGKPQNCSQVAPKAS